jgi:hypothetical protein
VGMVTVDTVSMAKAIRVTAKRPGITVGMVTVDTVSMAKAIRVTAKRPGVTVGMVTVDTVSMAKAIRVMAKRPVIMVVTAITAKAKKVTAIRATERAALAEPAIMVVTVIMATAKRVMATAATTARRPVIMAGMGNTDGDKDHSGCVAVKEGTAVDSGAGAIMERLDSTEVRTMVSTALRMAASSVSIITDAAVGAISLKGNMAVAGVLADADSLAASASMVGSALRVASALPTAAITTMVNTATNVLARVARRLHSTATAVNFTAGVDIQAQARKVMTMANIITALADPDLNTTDRTLMAKVIPAAIMAPMVMNRATTSVLRLTNKRPTDFDRIASSIQSDGYAIAERVELTV